MKKGENFLLSITLISILFLFGVITGCIDESIGLLSNTIKVGVISDITGPTSQIQTPIHKGIQTYLAHINDTGGIHGRKFKVLIKDGRYSVERDVANFKDLVYRNKIFMLFVKVKVKIPWVNWFQSFCKVFVYTNNYSKPIVIMQSIHKFFSIPDDVKTPSKTEKLVHETHRLSYSPLSRQKTRFFKVHF